jgi:5-methylcytosine-specific restriction endonuclease McrA
LLVQSHAKLLIKFMTKKRKRKQSDLNRRRERNRMVNRQALQNKPKWVSWLVFAPIYKACPEGFTVDHIIPLKGENVSGLHVPFNLQYLTREENYKKGNQYE